MHSKNYIYILLIDEVYRQQTTLFLKQKAVKILAGFIKEYIRDLINSSVYTYF